jgi:hypothetical protein
MSRTIVKTVVAGALAALIAAAAYTESHRAPDQP